MTHTINEFKTIKDLVEQILSKEERARNDDKYLTYRVFEEISRSNGEGIFISFKLWCKFPAFETVKRTRAFIQNKECRFLPTDESVKAKRLAKSQDISRIMVLPGEKWGD